MKRSFLIMGGLLGGLTSLVSMAIIYLANILFGLPFLPFDLFEGLRRLLPARFNESIIRAMMSLITALHLAPTSTPDTLVEQLLGIGLIGLTGIVFGLILSWLALAHQAWLMRGALLGGGLLSLGMLVVELTISPSSFNSWLGISWLVLLILAWSLWLYRLVGHQSVLVEQPPQAKKFLSATLSAPMTRRDFLTVAWSSLASLVLLLVELDANRLEVPLVTPLATPSPAQVPVIDLPYGPQYTSGPAASPSVDVLDNRLAAAPGTRDEVTAVDKFYQVDINLLPPVIDAAYWRLVVNGLVQNPTTYTLAELVAMPAVTQAVTIACISNFVGGDLIGGNYWTGVPLKTILDQVGLQPTAQAISIKAADGYYESMPMSEAMDERTLLVYAMNGQALTNAHGFPLRIYIPDHYGMKQPKWITQLEVVDKLGSGYWEDSGWSKTAIAQTTSIIDTRQVDPATLANGGVFPLGGIAYAGARQIKKVELQIGDAAWVEAELRDPPVSPLHWVQWRYDWKPAAGTYLVRVRATDGDGNLQDDTTRGTFPEGATGLDQVNIQI